MKLIRKINTRFFIASLIIMLLLGFGLVIVLHYTINEQVEEKMENTYLTIKTQLEKGAIPNSFPPYFEVKIANAAKDTLFFNETTFAGYKEKNGEEFKQLNAILNISGITYKIEIRESLMETSDFIENIVSLVIISICLFFLALIIINRKVSRSVWNGFNYNLEKVKSYSLQQESEIELKHTNIIEFDQLNEVLINLTNRVSNDYKNLKQFSEDASHELQTPLAIIRSKVESLIESNKLSDELVEKLKTIYDNTNRLTRLSKDLLLLTKLENNQFNIENQVSFMHIIRDKITDWQEIIELKNLKCEFNLNDDLKIKMNLNLADILISNLLSNAITHTDYSGIIKADIKGNTIHISNSGKTAIKNPNSIFNRFHKESSSQQSVGLGLSIVKRICELHQIKIEYLFLDGMHGFSLQFPV